MVKCLKSEEINETLTLSECSTSSDYRGKFWIWDEVAEMNLAMGANTEREAFAQVISYYQTRLKDVTTELQTLSTKVNGFLAQFADDDGDS